MPQLLLFAPCERVIVAQEDQSVSLISLMTGLSASLPFPADQPIPENATIPVRWYVLSVWKSNPQEVGSHFSQRVLLKSPSGRDLISIDLKFAVVDPNQLILRGVVHLPTFPTREFGTHMAVLLFRQTEDSEWSRVAEYPIEVTRGPMLDLKSPRAPSQS